MKFEAALQALVRGFKIKRKNWTGFWQLEDGEVMLHCKDGTIMDIRETQDIVFTLSNIAAEDWEVLDADYTFNPTDTVSFSEALRLLKNGKKVARKGWNGKGMFLLHVPSEKWGIIDKIGLGIPKGNLLSWIGMKTADNKFVPWLASQSDILAEDWIVVE